MTSGRTTPMKSLALACAALMTVPVMASATDTIRATSGFGPSHVLATSVYPTLFAKLEEFTDGAWTGQDTAGGLLAPNEMNAGLRDGVTELGAVILPYFAADYTETMLPGELSMVGTNNMAISAAVTEYIVNCAECQAEFTENGQVYLGADTTPTYNFLSTVPITSLDDMKGQRIRTAGAVFTRFVEALGAEPVQMPSSELFEALNSGVIDATYSSIPDLKNAQLYDVVKDVTLIRLGVFNAAATTNASQLLWMRMSEEDRDALVHATQIAQAVGVEAWLDAEQEALATGEEKGIKFLEPDAGLLAAAKTFNEDHIANVAAALSERGVTNAQEKVDAYLALVEKWHGLVNDETTAEELGELRYQEIWSKVDFSTYGM